MLSQEVQTPARVTVWSEGAFSTARHKLHVASNDDADIVPDAHRRLPDHMIVATDSTSIAPISLPIEHAYGSFQTTHTQQVQTADGSAIPTDLEHRVEHEQHERHEEQEQQGPQEHQQGNVSHHDEHLQQQEPLHHHQELVDDHQTEQQPQQQPEQQQQQQQQQQQRHHNQQSESQVHGVQEQSLQQQQLSEPDLGASSHGIQRETSRKKTGSNRRKRYRCGYCHEIGHNQKTCPLRPPSVPTSRPRPYRVNLRDTAQLQRVATKIANELGRLYSEMNPTPSAEEWQSQQQLSYDAVLEAANEEVMRVNQSVADASTDQEFENAIDQLQSSVSRLEKVANLVYKGALIAHTISRNVEHPS
eukprot:TRINITY_DN1404_c0_g1_i1.p2 TRINITY_DN1404_c0_g1~~TRINITY_DN1404_c0_g1_i1.p2  ORF type:complete len:360 (-),score=62.95 TRINITY_DN1404_c0_g1_i1:2879-3958(-)